MLTPAQDAAREIFQCIAILTSYNTSASASPHRFILFTTLVRVVSLECAQKVFGSVGTKSAIDEWDIFIRNEHEDSACMPFRGMHLDEITTLPVDLMAQLVAAHKEFVVLCLNILMHATAQRQLGS